MHVKTEKEKSLDFSRLRNKKKSAHLRWTDLFWNTRPVLRTKKQPNRSPAAGEFDSERRSDAKLVL